MLDKRERRKTETDRMENYERRKEKNNKHLNHSSEDWRLSVYHAQIVSIRHCCNLMIRFIRSYNFGRLSSLTLFTSPFGYSNNISFNVQCLTSFSSIDFFSFIHQMICHTIQLWCSDSLGCFTCNRSSKIPNEHFNLIIIMWLLSRCGIVIKVTKLG